MGELMPWSGGEAARTLRGADRSASSQARAAALSEPHINSPNRSTIKGRRAHTCVEAEMVETDLVLIHGFWSSPATWDRLTTRMREDPDLRDLRVSVLNRGAAGPAPAPGPS